jgi:ABC-type multidrug transport system ATPase subunit
MSAIIVKDLVKRYGRFAAVQDVSFEVAAGHVTALTRIGALSGGQRRRVDLGLAIIGQPEIKAEARTTARSA